MLIYAIMNFHMCFKMLHLSVFSLGHNGGDFEKNQDFQRVTSLDGVHHA
jgi:hypothetical protein